PSCALKGQPVRAVGRAHGPLNTTHTDPEGVAPQPCMCDPFRVGFYSGPATGALPPALTCIPYGDQVE
ncbi:MAG TPA: hypothetical protein VGO91_10400, partial [Pyrinomonadaceae bacterium]|nr:hypothetical protein [Pyrinomonadaceae bacterium]